MTGVKVKVTVALLPDHKQGIQKGNKLLFHKNVAYEIKNSQYTNLYPWQAVTL